jgi:hypothetical protein
MMASAVLHAYWALGGTWFLATALNMDVERIPRNLVFLTWIFVFAMIGLAILALVRVGILRIRLPQWPFAVVLWIVTVLMFGGAVFNALIPRFWDRWVFAHRESKNRSYLAACEPCCYAIG